MNRIAVCIAGAAMVLALSACGNQSPTTTSPGAASQSASTASAVPAPSALKITSWGPDSTKAGVVFNEQPNGNAALWAKLNQPLVPGDVAAIEFNGALLQCAVTNNFVSAFVPAELYAKPGIYKVRVIVRKGGQSMQSNDVQFTVK